MSSHQSLISFNQLVIRKQRLPHLRSERPIDWHVSALIPSKFACRRPKKLNSKRTTDCFPQTIRRKEVKGLYEGATPPLIGWMFMDSTMLGFPHLIPSYPRWEGLLQILLAADSIILRSRSWTNHTKSRSEAIYPRPCHCWGHGGRHCQLHGSDCRARLQVQYAVAKSHHSTVGTSIAVEDSKSHQLNLAN